MIKTAQPNQTKSASLGAIEKQAEAQFTSEYKESLEPSYVAKDYSWEAVKEARKKYGGRWSEIQK